MAVYLQTNQIKTLGAAGAISATDSGKTLITIAQAATIYTLPTLALGVGCHYHIINGAGTVGGVITFRAPAATLLGSVIVSGIAPVANITATAGAQTDVNFANNTSVAGDYIDLYCNGTNYFVSGMSSVALGITFA